MMSPTGLPAHEERLKQLAALHRAIPVTRMVDYGVPLGDALAVHRSTVSDDAPAWDEACEAAARHHATIAAEAQQAGHQKTAAQAWRATSALLQCAQLAFNADGPRKQALYEQAHEAMSHHARLAGDLAAFTLQTPAGTLHGWQVLPPASETCTPPSAVVLVLGGLSGWGAAYLDMGRALAARGLIAILAEGPGQGLTRMSSGMHLGAQTLPLFGKFFEAAQALSAPRLGVWGNSFGGLFAAHLAAADARVQAVCVNGAPMVPTVPGFRTAREQMNAVFGVDSEHDLAERLHLLAMTPALHRIGAAMLIVEGGRDSLLQPGEQAAFNTLAPPGRSRLLAWQDGEHTIYNHAGERNALVADWFADQLKSSGD